MRARAAVVAEGDGRGGTRLARLRSEAPLALRRTPDALYLVGGAGGPLGGDDLTVEIEVRSGARLAVRTSAASIALPGKAPSSTRMRVQVAAGGELRWLPEPLVAARACRHGMDAVIILETGARLMWREELVLGRHRDVSGSVKSRLLVDLDGRALVRQELALGPDHPEAATSAVVAGARCAGSVLVVEPAWDTPPEPVVVGPRVAVLPLHGPAVQVVALADDARCLRRGLDIGIAAVAPRSTFERPLRAGTNGPC